MLALVWKAMLASIQFDIEFGFFAKEIQAVFSQRMLAAKFISIEPPVT